MASTLSSNKIKKNDTLILRDKETVTFYLINNMLISHYLLNYFTLIFRLRRQVGPPIWNIWK